MAERISWVGCVTVSLRKSIIFPRRLYVLIHERVPKAQFPTTLDLKIYIGVFKSDGVAPNKIVIRFYLHGVFDAKFGQFFQIGSSINKSFLISDLIEGMIDKGSNINTIGI